MTKKQILMLTLSLCMVIATFAQKNELKAAEKALKKSDFTTTLSTLSQIEGIIANADSKTKAKYYFLKGKALFANGNYSDIEGVADALNNVMSIEEKSGGSYSSESGAMLQKIITKLSNKVNNDYSNAANNKDVEGFKSAAAGYEQLYKLYPSDTASLFNSALVYSFGKDYVNSNKNYEKLLELGYTGIVKIFSGTSKVNDQPVNFNSQKELDRNVKLGVVTDPKVEVLDSKLGTMFKSIASNYSKMGEGEKALSAITKAREILPNDYDLIIEETNIYYEQGNNVKFKEKLEEAIKLNPTNPSLYFNVGVMNLDLGNSSEAIANFKKAIELNPEYGEAYNNLGTVILSKSEAVQKELDANAMNFAKYDQIKETKLLPIYREALPVFEKAYEFSPSEQLKNLLNSFYENLSMEKRID